MNEPCGYFNHTRSCIENKCHLITCSVEIHDSAEHARMPVKEVLFANALPMSTRQIAETSVRFRQKRRRQRLVTYAADVDDDLVGVFDVTNRPGNRHRVVVEAQRSPNTHHDVSLDDHQR